MGEWFSLVSSSRRSLNLSAIWVLALAAVTWADSHVSDGANCGFQVVGNYVRQGKCLQLKGDGRYTEIMVGSVCSFATDGTYTVCGQKLFLRWGSVGIKSSYRETQYIIVPWGRRLYIVEYNGLLRFCNSIVNGYRWKNFSYSEPRESIYGYTYIRKGDEKIPVTGNPKLPVTWKGHLLRRFIRGKIVRVNQGGQVAIANIGHRDGLRNGDRLMVISSSGVVRNEVDVVSAKRSTSAVRLCERTYNPPSFMIRMKRLIKDSRRLKGCVKSLEREKRAPSFLIDLPRCLEVGQRVESLASVIVDMETGRFREISYDVVERLR